MLIIKPIEPNVQGDVTHFFQARWGSTQMVISSGVYDCASMDGFIALNEKKRNNWTSYIYGERRERGNYFA